MHITEQQFMEKHNLVKFTSANGHTYRVRLNERIRAVQMRRNASAVQEGKDNLDNNKD